MSPKIVDKEEKKRQIVQAAISVFAQKGFNNTKMNDIADAGTIGKGTIYEYFRSKDEIFMEAFNFFKRELDGEIAKRIYLLTDPKEKMVTLLKTSFEFYVKFSDFIEIMFDFWAEGIRNRHEKINLKPIYEQYRQYLASFLDEGIRSGVFRKMNSSLVAAAIFAAMDGLLLQWIIDKNDFSITEAGHELTRTILLGIEEK